LDHPLLSPTEPSQSQTPGDTSPSVESVPWRRITQIATVGMFLILFGALLYFARAALLPVASAFVIGTVLGPLQRLAAAYRIPAWAFAAVAVLSLIALLQGATIVLSASIIEWIKHAGDFVDAIRHKLLAFESWFAAFRNLQDALGTNQAEAGVKLDITSLVQSVLAFLTPALSELVVFFATLFFYLLGRNDLRRNLILLFRGQDARLRAIRILNETEEDLTRYVGTVTVINLAVGAVTAAGAWLMGFPNPLLTGVLAFACNYIPYVGPAFVVVILLGVGLIVFPSLGYAFLAPLLFVGLTTIEGHVFTPNIVGRRLTLNPLAVFLSLTFWTWLWGPIGALLSVPFLIIALVVFNHLVTDRDAELPD